ncbi:uncharacterized protein LOC108669406 [Hyalella azteca]|uniref:Uncharacterized protein LOC108669406 n=1 Tax=Hyalella azteca TaxID=294128 RepID=A0A8B7NF29_HYAAZ|nr:uncharacterized protein LOC108669406 [Hyalella azteca]
MRPRMSTVFIALVLLLAITHCQADIIMPDQYIQLMRNQKLLERLQPRDRCMSEEARNVTSLLHICSLLWGTVPYEGRCVQLHERGPCRADHWIVINKHNHRAKCVPQLCPKNSVSINDRCEMLGVSADAKFCRKTLQLIVNEFGEAECECPVSKVWHSPTDACYTPHSKGPCESGYTIQVANNGLSASGKCRPNLCETPGNVPMTSSCEVVTASMRPLPAFKCYALATIGPCKKGWLAVDTTTSQVTCSNHGAYAIIPVPIRACSVGSMRDESGRCRSDMTLMPTHDNLETKDSVPTVQPGSHGDGNVCPEDYVLIGGTCTHLVSGA